MEMDPSVRRKVFVCWGDSLRLLAPACLFLFVSLPFSVTGQTPLPVSAPGVTAPVSTTGNVYVANLFSDTVSVIDDSTNTVAATANVGLAPYGVAFDPLNNDIYVANAASSDVSVINVSTNMVVAMVNLKGRPYDVAFDSFNNEIYVTQFDSNAVWVISGATNNVVATVTVGSEPDGVVFDPSNNDVYVANVGSDSVSVINGATNSVVATVTVGRYPAGIAFDPSNNDIYVADAGSNTVSIISDSSNTVVGTVNVVGFPDAVAFDSSNNDVYVAASSGSASGIGTVSVISSSTNTVVTTVSVGIAPLGLAFDSSNNDVYVTNSRSNTTSVISGSSNTVVATINVGGYPLGVAVAYAPVEQIDFSVSATSPLPVNSGATAVSTITVTSVNGFAGNVTLSFDSLPAGLTCRGIIPGSVAGSGTATLSCISTTPNVYAVTISGTSGTLTRTAPVTFSFSSSPSFSLTSTNSAFNLGASGSITITVTSLNQFSGAVTFTASSPVVTLRSCTPANVSPARTATAFCTLNAFMPGAYAVTLIGTAGGTTSVTNSTFIAVDVGDFTITASSSTGFVDDSLTSTITLTSTYDFTGTVLLADTAPADLSCLALTEANVRLTANSTATLSLTCASATPSTYSVSLTANGTPGIVSHRATSTFNIMSSEIVSCGHDMSCYVETNSVLSDVRFAGNTIQLATAGPFGTLSFVRVTVPKSIIPIVKELHVFVNNVRLSRSSVSITSDSDTYLIVITLPSAATFRVY